MENIDYPINYYFTSEHEWVCFVSDELAYIGLTELAIRELDEIEKIEIDTPGKTLQKNQVLGRIINKEYTTKLIMPLSGTVIEANSEYCSDCKVINEQYVHDHWIIKIRPILPIDISTLLTLDTYKEYKTKKMLHLIQYVNKTELLVS